MRGRVTQADPHARVHRHGAAAVAAIAAVVVVDVSDPWSSPDGDLLRASNGLRNGQAGGTASLPTRPADSDGGRNPVRGGSTPHGHSVHFDYLLRVHERRRPSSAEAR